MLHEFIRILEAASNRIPGSSLKDDEDLLEEMKRQDDPADMRIIQMIRLRLEERKVLLVWQLFAQDCITILRNRKVIKTTRSSKYLNQVIFPLMRGEKVYPE